jgi:hypothetical protein
LGPDPQGRANASFWIACNPPDALAGGERRFDRCYLVSVVILKRQATERHTFRLETRIDYFVARASLIHFLTILCRCHHDVSLYFAYSLTSALQEAVAC